MALISMWTFGPDMAADDSATSDGSQNGTLQNGATTSNGSLVLDGSNDYVEVAPDNAFQLSTGTIITEFTPDDRHSGTVLSRDSAYYDGGGHFMLQVTSSGSVQVRHQTLSTEHYENTGSGFYDDGDTLRVTYSWDQGTGGTFTVENLTQGTDYTSSVSSEVTMDMGASYNEPWTIGASQMSSSDNTADNLDSYFEGQVDYVAIHDTVESAASQENPDGVVDGSSDAELINVGYTDDEGDTVDASTGTEIDAGGGNDTITTGSGADSIRGGDGADSISSGAGNDTIDAGAGDDTVDGGTGWVEVDLGTGNDEFTGSGDIDAGDGNDEIDLSSATGSMNIVDGGAGNDTIRGIDDHDDYVYLSEGNDWLDAEDGSGDDWLDASNVTAVTIDLGSDSASFGSWTQHAEDFEHVVGSSESDWIEGDWSENELYGGAGDDTLDGAKRDDTIYGQAGDDSIDGGEDNDLLDGGDGSDTIIGGKGDDTIYTGQGGDSVDGGDGSDTIHLHYWSGGSNNTIVDTGSSGWDKLVLDSGGDSFEIQGDFSLADGIEEVDFSSGGRLTSWDALDFDLTGVTITGTAHISDDSGSGTDDTVTGSSQGDIIDGNGGDDSISGAGGDDTISGGAGSDTLYGDAGADSITGGGGGDTLDGGTGDDTLTMDGAGHVDGGDDTDTLVIQGWGHHVPSSSTSGTYTFKDGQVLTYQNIETIVVQACFTPGTTLLTPAGPRAVETLAVGDLVLTADHGPQPVQWIVTSEHGARSLDAAPNLRPIRIAAGALGNDTDLWVSRQHAFLARLPQGDRLIRAAHLARFLPEIAQIDRQTTSAAYVHILLPRHEIVFASGAVTESFYPGPMMLRGLAPEARRSLLAIRPDLSAVRDNREGIRLLYGPSARPYFEARTVRRLVKAGGGAMVRAALLAAPHLLPVPPSGAPGGTTPAARV